MQRIFVGDVQGCAAELERILVRARTLYGDGFELWLVGDLVGRGPASLDVLERVGELAGCGRAVVVIGNHELGFLRAALGIRPPEPEARLEALLASPERDEWVEWIRKLPLVAPGEQGGAPFAMVHASAHPDWTRDELLARARRIEARLGGADRGEAVRLLSARASADPDRDVLDRLTRCRSITSDGRWSSEPPSRPEDAWHRRFAARGHDYAVVYGHWALQGLHVDRGLRGLDTACVHASGDIDGRLTAWLPDPEDRDPFRANDTRFWQVPAFSRQRPR
jgi:bis(5'-nucleosyl)-tetraphosphatase (symmetrical)